MSRRESVLGSIAVAHVLPATPVVLVEVVRAQFVVSQPLAAPKTKFLTGKGNLPRLVLQGPRPSPG